MKQLHKNKKSANRGSHKINTHYIQTLPVEIRHKMGYITFDTPQDEREKILASLKEVKE